MNVFVFIGILLAVALVYVWPKKPTDEEMLVRVREDLKKMPCGDCRCGKHQK